MSVGTGVPLLGHLARRAGAGRYSPRSNRFGPRRGGYATIASHCCPGVIGIGSRAPQI